MKFLLRILLLLAMARLAYEATIVYAFRFENGYPLWPLLGLAACFWAYLKLRPVNAKRRPVTYDAQSVDSMLFLVLAVLSSAFILDLRHQPAFQPLWFLHLATLTFFQLLIPYIIAHPFGRRHAVVTAISSLFLLGLLWKGSANKREALFPSQQVDSHFSHILPAAVSNVIRPVPVSLVAS